MGKKSISTSQSATQMVADINDNFSELYQGGSGGGTSAETKRVKVYDVMTGVGTLRTVSGVTQRYLPVNLKAGTKVIIEKSDRGTNYQALTVTAYDAEKSESQRLLNVNISQGSVVGDFDTEIELTIDTAYFLVYGATIACINIYHYEDVPLAGASPWLGKKWLVIGDSISVEDTEAGLATEGYAIPVARALGMQRENFAVGGTTTEYPIYNTYGTHLVSSYDTDYDLVTIMYGTNDKDFGCSIGSINDSVYQNYESGNIGDSYIARLQILYERVREQCPNAVIAFLTPIKMDRNADGVEDVDSNKTTEAFAAAMQYVADYYHAPCLNLYNAINPCDATTRSLFFINGDGLHPNDAGHRVYIMPLVKAFIESLTPNTEEQD